MIFVEQDPANTANKVDLHDSVASHMKDLMLTSTRFTQPNIGLIAVSSCYDSQCDSRLPLQAYTAVQIAAIKHSTLIRLIYG